MAIERIIDALAIMPGVATGWIENAKTTEQRYGSARTHFGDDETMWVDDGVGLSETTRDAGIIISLNRPWFSVAQKAKLILANAAEASPDHWYLSAKRIRLDAIPDIGLRQLRNGDLLLPILDREANIVNVKRIDAEGRTRYLKGGGRSGCYARIPPRDGAPAGRVFVVEFATGVTVWEATGREIIVALDASNLVAVTREIGTHEDCVGADNDSAEQTEGAFARRIHTCGSGHRAAIEAGLPFYLPPTPGANFNALGANATAAVFGRAPISAIPVFGEEIERSTTEMPIAARLDRLGVVDDPANAAAIALDVALSLELMAPHGISLAGIRAILEAALARGPGTVHPSTLDHIMQRLESAQERRRCAALKPVSLPGGIEERHQYERHLSIPIIGDEDWHGVIVLCAPMGSGKTQRVGRPLIDWAIRTNRFVVAITHRRSLVRELSKRLKLDHYSQLQKDQEVEGIATCLPSITLENHACARSSRVVFIDEIAQALDFIASDSHCRTASGSNADVYVQLKEIIRQAECVMVADAGINQRTINMLESCLPDERFRVIEVVKPMDAGISAGYIFGRSAASLAVGDALLELESGGRVWIALESASRSQHIAKILIDNGYSVLVVNSDNTGEPSQAAFLLAPDEESRRYQAVIASPTIGSGISIEHRHVPDSERFTLGLYIGGGFTTTPADAAQQLRRVRYLDRFLLALIPNFSAVGHQNGAINARAARQASRIEGREGVIDEFVTFVSDVHASYQNARADFSAGLLWQLHCAGWTLHRDERTENEDVAAAIKVAATTIKAARWAAIMNAPRISDEQADRINAKEHKTEADALLLEALRIRQSLGLGNQPITDGILAFWDDGAVVPFLDRYSAWRGKLEDRDDSALPLTTRRFNTARTKAYRWIFDGMDVEAAGIRPKDAETILDRIMDRRLLLARLGIVGPKFSQVWLDRGSKLIDMRRPKSSMKVVAAMFRRMGITIAPKMVRTGKSSGGVTDAGSILENSPPSVTPGTKKKGTPRIRIYYLEQDSVKAMEYWANRRNAR